MNKSQVLQLLDSLILSQKISNPDQSIETLTSNLQEAHEKSLAFYRLRDLSKESIEIFKKRLNKSPAILVTTQDPSAFYTGDYILVSNDDFYNAQSILAKSFYPIDDIEVKAVTGTNGKTSVAFLGMQIANTFGRNSIYIGTLGLWKNGNCLIEEINNTTPSLLDFSRMVHSNKDSDTVVFVEVSSHALEQNRVHELSFSSAAWTNLTQDHLDYHKTMDNYFEAKLKIVDHIKDGGTLYFPETQEALMTKVQKTLKEKNVSCVIARPSYSSYNEIPAAFLHGFNKTNMDLAVCLNENNVDKSKKYSFKNIMSPPGRFATYEYKDNIVVVDYAHTPDALENILKELKEIYDGKKEIVTIFGCGGDRDKTKRPLMGNVALKFSDKVIVTSDNPRSENPMSIIEDIISGKIEEFKINENRKDAILHELNIAQNTVILVAGKGHEPYQEINGIKHDYSDIELVEGYINDI